jgi:hypothetical protein
MPVMIRIEDNKVVGFHDLANVCMGDVDIRAHKVLLRFREGVTDHQLFKLCAATNKHEFLAKIALAINKNESIVWLYPSESKETEHSKDTIVPLSCVRLEDYY